MDKKTILIIDDADVFRKIVAMILTKSGYHVIQAENGSQGIRILKKLTPDLILLDLNMPVMDGFETLAEIRKNSGLSEIPVIMLTLSSDKDFKIQALNSGADDYIVKPFDREELIARIEAVLRRSNAQQAPETYLKGNFSYIPLWDLLWIMESGSRSAVIHVESLDADIFVEYGLLIHVRMGELTGDEALAGILVNDAEDFLIRFDELPQDIPRKPAGLSKALMNASTILETKNSGVAGKTNGRSRIIKMIKKTLRQSECLVDADGRLEGFLSDISLWVLLQSLGDAQKTVRITLENMDGEIFIREGNLVYVAMNHFTGESALTRLLLLEKGHFTVRFDNLPDITDENSITLISILMKTIAGVDEIRDQINASQNENRILDIDETHPASPDFPGLTQYREMFPATYLDILTRLSGALEENFKLIESALQQGVLV